MMIMSPDLKSVLDVGIAALGGAAVGLEREWSGHTRGPGARFAGIRTFTLLGLHAGIAGWLWSNGLQIVAVALVAGGAALVLAAYVAASRVEIDGTTEAAALVVLAAGVLAGVHQLKLASAVIAVTAILLVEKPRLHAMVRRIDDASLRAGFRFAIMAVVVLPLLPSGPYGPLGGLRPRQLWTLVLFFTGLSFAGYLARRAAGAQRGYPIAGLVGGLLSSTGVTFTFARTSGAEAASGVPLALGVIGACSVMYVRVLVATTVLNSEAAGALVPYLAAPFLVAALIAWWGIRKPWEPAAPEKMPSNPLQFMSALQMAALFQVVLLAVRAAQNFWGQPGVLISAGVLGLADIDALVVSMAKDAAIRLPSPTVAQAIAIGVLTNTLLKLGIGLVLGRRDFRRLVGVGLAAAALASAVSIAWLP